VTSNSKHQKRFLLTNTCAHIPHLLKHKTPNTKRNLNPTSPLPLPTQIYSYIYQNHISSHKGSFAFPQSVIGKMTLTIQTRLLANYEYG
jgi:hypothetical protein